MREFKKYPNRRLYDIKQSCYVTIKDIRNIILDGETISVVDSRTRKDLTRTVLLQIIAERECAGQQPILTNTVLEQLIRSYGNQLQGVMSEYIEQSVIAFFEGRDAEPSPAVDAAASGSAKR